MNRHDPPDGARTVSLFRNGRNQAVRIPVAFELPGNQATIRKEGDRLIIEPKGGMSAKAFGELLDKFEPIPDFPDVDDSDLPPLRDVDFQ